jgi:hypothetical protein
MYIYQKCKVAYIACPLPQLLHPLPAFISIYIAFARTVEGPVNRKVSPGVVEYCNPEDRLAGLGAVEERAKANIYINIYNFMKLII